MNLEERKRLKGFCESNEFIGSYLHRRTMVEIFKEIAEGYEIDVSDWYKKNIFHVEDINLDYDMHDVMSEKEGQLFTIVTDDDGIIINFEIGKALK